MKKTNGTTIEVQGATITILLKKEGDYISLTDMVKNFLIPSNSRELEGRQGETVSSCPPKNGLI